MSDRDPRPAPSVLRRLLGSPEPELTCDECFDLLDEYVELELEPAGPRADDSIPGMAPHLEGCAACREEHESLVALVKADRYGTA